MRSKGFTFVEVLVAILLLALAVTSAASILKGSVKATLDAKEMSVATWLLQKNIVELETKLETQGIGNGCERKKEGKFPEPYEKFTWIQYCNEIDFQLPQLAESLIKSASPEGESEKDDPIMKMLLDSVNQYLNKAVRELHAEVVWQKGTQTKKISATTHFARYDLPFNLPVPGTGEGGS